MSFHIGMKLKRSAQGAERTVRTQAAAQTRIRQGEAGMSRAIAGVMAKTV